MAYVCQLVDGSGTLASIDLRYNLAAGISLLNQGIRINDPEILEIWGGRKGDQLVRREEGRRVIPMSFYIRGSTGENLIDRVNAVEEMLRQAARYRKDGWGGEIFLEFKIDDATYTVRYPVLSGQIDKNALMKRCCEPDDRIDEVPVILNCEAYWEADTTYTLENYIDNPGFWRGAAPGDSWAEVNAADVTSTFDTTNFEVMGQALQMVIAPDAVNDTGVQSDNITVVASTQYYFECRCRHTTGADDLTARVYDVSNAAVIAASALTFDNQDNAFEKLGVAFTTPVGCVSTRIEILRLAANSTAGNKTYQVDAVYLDDRGDAPTGWSSGRNLMNQLDGADEINVLCVTEIPGETPAETRLDMTPGQDYSEIHVARRTRDNPHNFIWELLPVNAVVTAGDAACLDSALAADATAPGGQRVDVSFAGTQAMALRCYWSISSNLASYNGRFMVLVLCEATGSTDTINMRVDAIQDTVFHRQGYIEEQAVAASVTGDWPFLSGWSLLSFPIGTHENDLWAASNFWRIRLYAEHISGDGINDTLRIAAVYLVPLDEGYIVTGQRLYAHVASTLWSIMDWDGDRGAFPYNSAGNIYYSNYGTIGQFPILRPSVENWFYVVWFYAGELDITDTMTVAVQYRSRGIFLRGTNP